MPENSEISLHEIKVVAAYKASGSWLTHKEVGELAEGVADRTIRQHTKRLVGLGLLDSMELFPAHRYRWSEKANKRNEAYVGRLERAAEAFGVQA